MKCPFCVELKHKSRVYPGMGATTLMGWSSYYDEDGQFHSHDPNVTTTGYRCSEGHTWQRESLSPCPSCLYGREDKDDQK